MQLAVSTVFTAGIISMKLAVPEVPRRKLKVNVFWKIVLPDVSLTAVTVNVPETVLAVVSTLMVRVVAWTWTAGASARSASRTVPNSAEVLDNFFFETPIPRTANLAFTLTWAKLVISEASQALTSSYLQLAKDRADRIGPFCLRRSLIRLWLLSSSGAGGCEKSAWHRVEPSRVIS